MNYANSIMAALENHVMGMSLDIDVVYPNDKREPRDNAEYLQVFHLFGPTSQACLGDDGKDMTDGVFQINIVTPQGIGRSAYIDSVLNRFSRGTVIEQEGVSLRITTNGLGVPYLDRNNYIQPLDIQWQVFTPSRLSK